MRPWTVATYNIRHGLGRDGRVDLERTAQEIASFGADVIGVQEVDQGFGPRSGYEDQTERLGALLGMSACFGAAVDRPAVTVGKPRRRYGLALLTPHQLVSHTMHLLPGPPDRPPFIEPRGVLHARVRRGEGEGDTLDVLVTHLDPGLRRVRADQARGIAAITAQLPGSAVLIGDLNTSPGASELTPWRSVGWREAADDLGEPTLSLRRLLGALSFGALGSSARRPTFPAALPLRRIDSLWIRGGLSVTSLAVGPRLGSDHRPVIGIVD